MDSIFIKEEPRWSWNQHNSRSFKWVLHLKFGRRLARLPRKISFFDNMRSVVGKGRIKKIRHSKHKKTHIRNLGCAPVGYWTIKRSPKHQTHRRGVISRSLSR